MASDGTSILMFHRVLPAEPVAFGLPSCYRIRGTALTKGELHEVLDTVGPILPLEAVEDALDSGRAPPRGVVLTFDDGYREHLDVVTPVLRRRGATATFYVATGLHGCGRRVALVDAWYWLLDHARRSEIRLWLPGGKRFGGCLDTLEGKSQWVMGPPKAALLAADVEAQWDFVERLAQAVNQDLPEDLAARLYLRPMEWRLLVAEGMRVGAHSVTHPRLTQLDDETLGDEVRESVERVGGVSSPVTFAYPDGAHDPRAVAVVRGVGVRSAVTCEEGEIAFGTDPLRLPRVFVRLQPHESIPTFAPTL